MDRLSIAQVFGSQPRNGGNYWWQRLDPEDEIRNLFRESTNKKVVLIDGPSGSGKTSLAYRTFFQERVPHNYVAIDSDMTWEALCERIISIPKRQDEARSLKVGFSIRNFLPGGGYDVDHRTNFDALKDLQYASEYVDRITVDSIVDMMIEEGISLVIDDCEKASSELIKKIGNLAKKLSNPIHTSPNSKLVIISCKRTFEDLIDEDETLEGRIFHITLGGLGTSDMSWAFLLKGFEKLNIVHPGKSKIKGEQNYLKECQQSVYDATGGILKSLTDLGEILALDSYQSQSLKAKEVIAGAQKLAQKNIDTYVRRFDGFVEMIAQDEHVRAVLGYLYRTGINRIHEYAQIDHSVAQENPGVSTNSGVSKLVEIGFLVPTGINGSKLFPAQPNYALATCVALTRSKTYRVPLCLREGSEQRHLPLAYEW